MCRLFSRRVDAEIDQYSDTFPEHLKAENIHKWWYRFYLKDIYKVPEPGSRVQCYFDLWKKYEDEEDTFVVEGIVSHIKYTLGYPVIHLIADSVRLKKWYEPYKSY